MNCPICNVALVMAERHGVEIDYCPKCRGIWLDRGELDKMIERVVQENATRSVPRAGEQAYGYGKDDKRHYDDHHYEHYRKKSFLRDLFD